MLLDLEEKGGMKQAGGQVQGINAPDVKESFEVGREDDDMQPNIWLPHGVFPGFREVCMDFYWVSESQMTSTSLVHIFYIDL